MTHEGMDFTSKPPTIIQTAAMMMADDDGGLCSFAFRSAAHIIPAHVEHMRVILVFTGGLEMCQTTVCIQRIPIIQFSNSPIAASSIIMPPLIDDTQASSD
jgi:hypothetical protein